MLSIENIFMSLINKSEVQYDNICLINKFLRQLFLFMINNIDFILTILISSSCFDF